MKIKDAKSYILCTLLTVAISVAYGVLGGGLLSILLGLLISALLGSVMCREHYSLGIANSLVALLVFTLFYGPFRALMFGVPYVILGATLAVGTRFKLSLSRLLIVCSVIFILDFMVGVMQLSAQGVTISGLMLDVGQQMRAVFLQQYPDPGMSEMIDQVISKTVDLSVMLSPSVFIVMSIIMAYLLIVIYKKVMMKQQEDMTFLPPFDALQADKIMALLFFVVLMSLTVTAGKIYAAAVNVVIILCFIFLFLGISVCDKKLKQNGTKKSFRRVLLVALILGSTVFFMLPIFALIICGLADAFFDFRHLQPEADAKHAEDDE